MFSICTPDVACAKDGRDRNGKDGGKTAGKDSGKDDRYLERPARGKGTGEAERRKKRLGHKY